VLEAVEQRQDDGASECFRVDPVECVFERVGLDRDD
jgi:hypothetical protein